LGTPFYQVDVFTDHIFGGNPLAVFTEGQKFKEGDLQKIAREMNLSETTFIYPSTKNEADFDVRIFTPSHEIPFAGHPTIGSAYVLRKYGVTTENPLRLNFKAGVIPVSTEGNRSFMQHPPAEILHELIPSKTIAEALGISLSSLDGNLPIKVVTTGLPALFVPVNSLSIINRIAINTQTLNEVLNPLGINMIYPFCLETLNPDNTVHSRAFAPGMGIPEDPATGSVAGAMGAYWASLSDEVDISMVIEQGYAMQRPSLIHVEVSSREIQKIRVGGQCQSVFTGLMDL
jgi:trans-2,3-dihydro-3-hydroxyanthranilate isomerase